MDKKWTSIVITCPYEHWCDPLQKYLDHLPTELLLVVPDPYDGVIQNGDDVQEGKQNGVGKKGGGGNGVGSGGATLNALLVAAEHLSARDGHTTIVSNVLQMSRILIVHIGPSLLPLPMGLLPISNDSLRTNMDLVIEMATSLMSSKHSGIFVVGTDIYLKEIEMKKLRSEELILPDADICLVTVPASKSYATRHGVCITKNDQVSNILYQPNNATLDECSANSESVNILSGLVWLSSDVGESLLSLHSSSPLDSCTYMGVDSGEMTLQISFYYDILTSACSEVTAQDFIEGKCGKTLSRGRSASPAMKKARKLVWSALSNYKISELNLEGYEHVYLPASDSVATSEFITHLKTMNQLKYKDHVITGFVPDTGAMNQLKYKDHVITGFVPDTGDMNQLKYKDHVITGFVPDTGAITLLSTTGLPFKTAFNFGTSTSKLTAWQLKLLELCTTPPVHLTFTCLEGGVCHVIFSPEDPLHLNYKDPAATWLGLGWHQVLEACGLDPDSVWAGVPEEKRQLSNAALFMLNNRLVSLSDLKSCCDIASYFKLETCLKQEIFCNQIENFGKFESIWKHNDVFNIAAREGWANKLLESWDKRAFQCIQEESTSSKITGELARILAMTAEVLGSMARGRGGLRSGPACNRDFAQALSLMEQGRYKEGLRELSCVRTRWLNQPDRMVRAARHYEGAVQVLIRKTVLSAQKQVKVNFEQRSPQPELNQMVQVKCPARLDISGGWTDTPPICYELGGKVVDLAIKLNGEKPIGCRAKRVENLGITIILSDDIDEQVEIRCMADMDNHNNPNAKGALIKCCLIACNVLDPRSGVSFQDQLMSSLGSGLWLNSWAKLPQGSGLGTSSILASAVVAAVWRCCSVKFTRLDIIHSVLVVEQLLSTGGGWQDQVGGVCPAVNLGHSPQDTEVRVNVENLGVGSDFLDLLGSRLLVLYTGKPRLAKNLLQNVIRNWYCKDQVITQAFQDNYRNAEECAEAVLSMNLENIGSCMNKYYQIKKILAPGSEPEIVKNIFKELEDDILGGTLCGAGGGGFLFAILEEGRSMEDAVKRVQNLSGGSLIQHYVASVDYEGLIINDEDWLL